MRPPLDRLCRDLQFTFRDATLLEMALTHRSVGSRNNERLEFLGDAVLSFVISTALYQRFPGADEGSLSRLRSSLVKGDTLADLARCLNLGDFLHLGSGELKSGGFDRDSILADALEAIFGAIYLDSGIEPIRDLILRLFADKITAATPTGNLKDPKTRLQELLQARHEPLPTYTVISMQGEAHAQTFTVRCDVSVLPESTLGSAGSRRKAEQMAADIALRQLERE